MKIATSKFKKKSVLMLLAVCFVCTNEVFSQSSIFEKYVKQNARTKIGSQFSTVKDDLGNCKNYPFTVIVSQKPKFGKVELIKGTTTLKNEKNITSDGKTSVVNYVDECVGKTVPAINIYYIPNKNFTGIDVIKVKMRTSDSPYSEFTRIIYVE